MAKKKTTRKSNATKAALKAKAVKKTNSKKVAKRHHQNLRLNRNYGGS
jgi:hypothetical protein